MDGTCGGLLHSDEQWCMSCECELQHHQHEQYAGGDGISGQSAVQWRRGYGYGYGYWWYIAI